MDESPEARLAESPPVPPIDTGGDERIGYWVAAGILLFFGWGIGVGLNLVLHFSAPMNGSLVFGPLRISRTFGMYAVATLGLGALAGALGVILTYWARRSPPGKFVLPGQPY
jgi:hypothetical protein